MPTLVSISFLLETMFYWIIFVIFVILIIILLDFIFIVILINCQSYLYYILIVIFKKVSQISYLFMQHQMTIFNFLKKCKNN